MASYNPAASKGGRITGGLRQAPGNPGPLPPGMGSPVPGGLQKPRLSPGTGMLPGAQKPRLTPGAGQLNPIGNGRPVTNPLVPGKPNMGIPGGGVMSPIGRPIGPGSSPGMVRPPSPYNRTLTPQSLAEIARRRLGG